jgi:8-oxo-dGTP pyrophosphatase MutT (NUDIX family)
VRIISSRVVYENAWMRVHEDRTERPDGTPGLYGWVEKTPAALIVPLAGEHTWMVEQFRHPVGERCWEFPQGTSSDTTGEELARAELAEETGLRAHRLEWLGRLYYAYGLLNQPVDVWRATGLEPGPQALEPTEHGLIARRFTREEIERMIADNALQDAASVAAWHMATK